MPVQLKVGKVKINLTGFNAMVQHIEMKANEPLQRIKEYMLGRIRENFMRRGELFQDGVWWAELSNATKEIKKSLARTGQIRTADEPLVRTGRMKNAFYGHIVKQPHYGFRLIITNPTPYFRKHQSTRQSSRMIRDFQDVIRPLPRRVMMRIMDQDRQKIIEICKDWVGVVKRKHIKKTVPSEEGRWIKL